MATILVLNGPNLNLLGKREPSIYGAQSLETINKVLETIATPQGFQIQTLQSNSEAELIEKIHMAGAMNISFIIFNPAAFTHTSIALRDALLAVSIPFIEVHLSNTHAREAFRRTSYFSDIAIGVISGFGAQSYELAMHGAIKYLTLLNHKTNIGQ